MRRTTPCFLCLTVCAALVFLSACQAITAPDVNATLRAENTASVAEVTLIADLLVTQQIRAVLTEVAAETTIAELSSINRQLDATAEVAIPPTPIRQIGSAPGAEGAAMPEGGVGAAIVGGGSTQFANTGVTANKRDSDGCAEGFASEFPPTVQRIYAITRVTSLAAGSVIAAEWRYNGEIVNQASYLSPRDEQGFCVWFFIDPSLVALRPGQWSVSLLADGTPINAPITFTILGG